MCSLCWNACVLLLMTVTAKVANRCFNDHPLRACLTQTMTATILFHENVHILVLPALSSPLRAHKTFLDVHSYCSCVSTWPPDAVFFEDRFSVLHIIPVCIGDGHVCSYANFFRPWSASNLVDAPFTLPVHLHSLLHGYALLGSSGVLAHISYFLIKSNACSLIYRCVCGFQLRISVIEHRNHCLLSLLMSILHSVCEILPCI